MTNICKLLLSLYHLLCNGCKHTSLPYPRISITADTHGNKQAAEDPNPPSSRNDDDHATTIPGVTYHPMPDTSCPDKNDHLLTK